MYRTHLKGGVVNIAVSVYLSYRWTTHASSATLIMDLLAILPDDHMPTLHNIAEIITFVCSISENVGNIDFCLCVVSNYSKN